MAGLRSGARCDAARDDGEFPFQHGGKPSTVQMKASGKRKQDTIQRFAWEINSISVHLQEIHYLWAKSLSISVPQWRMIAALYDLDRGAGVPVNAVSKMLHVDPSFVTTQSKLLEKRGFVQRKPSPEDRRIVRMSLTDMTRKHLATLALRQERLNEYISAEFGARKLDDLIDDLAALKRRLERACVKFAADL